MIDRRVFLQAGIFTGLLLGSRPFPAAAAEDPSRVALVVGNNVYPQSPLNNAVNDARAVADVLRTAGFRVDLRTDTSRDDLARAVEAFGAAISRSDAELGFFYYAGHGTQVNWRNYLVPVDASVTSAAELASRCIDLGVLLGHMSKSRQKVFVVILDACRDNPFGAAFRPESKGLSPFDAPAGTVLAFSTAPGAVASDGTGKHGLYSESLVRELSVRGARLEDAFKRVRLNVRVASGGQQGPWESTSLESDIFLFPEGRKLSESELERRFEQELATWNRIKASKRTDDWVTYLREYPDGKFSEIAQARLNALMPPTGVSAVASPPVAANGAKYFELRAGLPVPDFYGSPKNPNFAGVYPLGRRYTVGDEATFSILDPISKVQHGVRTSRVTRVDADADRVEYDGGDGVTDLMGNLLRSGPTTWDPLLQIVPAELQINKKWSVRFRRLDASRMTDVDSEYQVVRREKVVVAAGEFDAFRVEGRGYARSFSGWSGLWRLEHRLWIVPGLNFNVRSELLVERGTAGNSNITDLISAKQHL